MVWAMVESNELVLLTVLGYMAADLLGQEVADVYKVKHYVENNRESKGSSRTTTTSSSSTTSTMESE
jgi:hypothetical protein